jgi:hypothetical protein
MSVSLRTSVARVLRTAAVDIAQTHYLPPGGVQIAGQIHADLVIGQQRDLANDRANVQVSKKQVFYANFSRCTLIHADRQESNGSQVAEHVPFFQACPAAIEQRAAMQAGSLEMVDALGTMRVVQCFDGREFDQNRILDRQPQPMTLSDSSFSLILSA